MAERNLSGDGCIVPVKENGKVIKDRWRVSISLGKDPITGKRKRISTIVRGSKADARKERDRLKQDHERGLRLDKSKATFGELTKEWLIYYEESGKASPDIVKLNTHRAKYICEFIGFMPLRNVDAETIESLMRAIKRGKEMDGCPIGGTTLHEYFQLTKRILQRGVNYDYIYRNPCDKVEAPRIDEPQRNALSIPEASRLFQEITHAEQKELESYWAKEARQEAWGKDTDRAHAIGLNRVSNILAARIALETGMRKSEILALTWSSVNLEEEGKASLKVVQALDKHGKPKTPKTKAGFRTVSIDEATAKHLSEWKELQASELAKFDRKQDKTTPVCCNNTGEYLNPANFGRWWRNFADSHGFKGLKLHELRHTQATQLLAQGIDVKTVQTRLGHANSSITLDWYSHAVPENDRKAGNLIGSLLAADNSNIAEFPIKKGA